MIPIEQMERLVKTHLNGHRLTHSYGVAQEAVRLAKRYGEDPQKAYYAGLCHDICKMMSEEEQLQWIKRSAIMQDDAFFRQPPIWHGYAAASFLKEKVGETDEDILNAVRYHTTGRAGMSLLEKIIFTADLTEEGRDYPDVNTVRTLADVSLDQAVLYILRYQLGRLLGGSLPICRDCVEAYNWFLALETEKSQKKELIQ